jgi:(p)ppGpp synthase/HD superfamily hydrolase
MTKVFEFAKRAFNEVKDEKGLPHSVEVTMSVRKFSDILEKVAILHDVVEDTNVTVIEIELEFGSVVADAVDAITRRPNEVYLTEYISRVKENEFARIVKIRDLYVNLSREGKDSLKPRYRKALLLLGVGD